MSVFPQYFHTATAGDPTEATRLWRGRRLLALIVVLSVLDLVATIHSDRLVGLGEANPLAAHFLTNGNLTGLLLLKLASVAGFAGALYPLRRRRIAQWVLWSALALLVLLTLHWGQVYLMLRQELGPALWR